MNYYNENDPKTAAWLRELISDAQIPKGKIDERSICDVQPGDIDGFTQCHFFAGIGGWPLALHLAGWPDSEPVWTGSPPCQPFSGASLANGGAKGVSDSRDLWPTFCRLIVQRKPSIVFGEQVGSAIGWGWLDRAAMDLEAHSYAIGAAILRADAVGAAHERKRLYWVAHSGSAGREGYKQVERIPIATPSPFAFHDDAFTRARNALAGYHGDLLPCNGLSVVMERHALEGYGNAIVPQLAAEFIRCAVEALTPAPPLFPSAAVRVDIAGIA